MWAVFPGAWLLHIDDFIELVRAHGRSSWCGCWRRRLFWTAASMVHGFRLLAIPAWGRQWEDLVLKDMSAERADTLVELALLLEGCRGRHWPRWRGLSRSCLSGARSWHTDAGVRAGVGGAGIGAGVGTGRLCANWTLDTGLSGARSWSWFGCHGRLFESHTQPRFRIMVLLQYRQGFHKSCLIAAHCLTLMFPCCLRHEP